MTTLSELSSQYWNSTLADQEKLKSQIQSLAKDNNISIEDLNSLFSSTANFTGSSRQGAGQTNIEDLYFDANGNVLVKPSIEQMYTDPSQLMDENYKPPSYVTGDSITKTATTGGGWDFYDPYAESQAALGDNGGWATVDPSFLRYDQLTPEQQQKLRTQGLFPNIDESSLKNQPTELDSIPLSDLNGVLNNMLELEQERIGNTAREPSNGYLARNPGTLLNIAGSALGVPFLNLSSSIMNTGNAIKNEDWGSALMGGVGIYNNAVNTINTRAITNGPPTSETQLYDNFSPQQFITQNVLGIENPTIGRYVGNAAVDSGVAALNGTNVGDALRNSVLKTATGDIGQALGLPSWMTGMISGGLPYLFNNSTSTTNNTQTTTTPPPAGGGSTTTPPFTPPDGALTTPPYSLTNPISVPTYTNPFANVPSPYTNNYTQPMLADYEEGADDESDTNNPYNTFVNYSGSGQNVYG